MLGKKALQTGVDVAQDVLAGENPRTATKKRAGKKGTKRKAQPRKNSWPPGGKRKTFPQQEKPEDKFSF